jgi:hypothetical protein
MWLDETDKDKADLCGMPTKKGNDEKADPCGTTKERRQ